MTNNLKFTLEFPRFDVEPVMAVFAAGLHVIYGESGVGKSNLVRELVGLKGYGKNNYCLISKSVPQPVYSLFQNPDNQILCSTVERELAFTLECQLADSDTISASLEQLKKMLPEPIDDFRHPATLSGGEKEILNLVVALALRPRVLIIDNALSFLSSEVKMAVIEQLLRSRKLENSIILWFTSEYNDLEFGLTKWNLTLANLETVKRVHPTVESKITFPRGQLSLTCANISSGFTPNKKVFANLDFTHSGFRSLGIQGSNGCGKTTLAKIILGILTPENGFTELMFNKIDRKPLVGYLDQFPERLIGYGTIDRFARLMIDHGLLEPARYRQCQRRALEYQIQWELLSVQEVATISWSTLRFLLVLLFTHCRYNVLILDEPTFGLGQDQRRKLIYYLGEYLQNGHLILISHDYSFIDQVCDQKLDLDAVNKKTDRMYCERIKI